MTPRDLSEQRRNPAHSESETNLGPRRQAWVQRLGAATRKAVEKDAACFVHQSVSTPCLSAISKAQGIWIEDLDGRRYMDFHGNSVHHIGYGHPRLKAAIARQMDELPFAPRRFASDVATQLAEKLGQITPGNLCKVLFTTGGSDAIETALKIARVATGRFKTLSFWDSFHGAGFGASSIGGEQLFRLGPIGPLLPGSEHIPPFDAYRNPFGIEHSRETPRESEVGDMVANLIRFALQKEGDVAAVIAEPNRAVPYIPPPGFWKKVRAACNEAGALLIFDEIPTGLGKTGRMFACDHDEVAPDILVLGKALGGGIVPIAACVCQPELDVCGDFALGHYTHEKNPVICRAALTTIEIIEDEGLVEHAASVGAWALERMADMMDAHQAIGDVRGRGFLLGIDLVKDRGTREPADDLAEKVFYRCLENGLSFKISMASVLSLYPALVTTKEQMETALGIIDAAISDASS